MGSSHRHSSSWSGFGNIYLAGGFGLSDADSPSRSRSASVRTARPLPRTPYDFLRDELRRHAPSYRYFQAQNADMSDGGLMMSHWQRPLPLLPKGNKRNNRGGVPYRLPFELWATIFALVEKFDYQFGSELPTDEQQPFWLSQVCSHWRTIALDTPHIWSRVDFRSRRRALIRLQRSGNAPLYLVYRCQDYEADFGALFDKAADLYFSCIKRVFVLHIYNLQFSPHVYGFIPYAEMPNLEVVSVWDVRSERDAGGRGWWDGLPLSIDQSPKLRKIYMHDAQILLGPPLHALAALTHLTLSSVHFTDVWLSRALYATLTAIADSLEFLTIKFAGKWEGEFTPFPARLALPNLETLELDCPPDFMCHFVSSLTTSASVYLECPNWDYRELGSLLLFESLQLDAVCRISHVEMSIWNDHILDIKAFSFSQGPPEFELHLSPIHPVSVFEQPDFVWRIFSPTSVTMLTIMTDADITGRSFASGLVVLLEAGAFIDTLHYRGDSPTSLLVAFRNISAIQESGRAVGKVYDVPLCAHIQTLSIHLFSGPRRQTKWNIDTTDLEDLQWYVKMRSNIGRPLKKLDINCPRTLLDGSGYGRVITQSVQCLQLE